MSRYQDLDKFWKETTVKRATTVAQSAKKTVSNQEEAFEYDRAFQMFQPGVGNITVDMDKFLSALLPPAQEEESENDQDRQKEPKVPKNDPSLLPSAEVGYQKAQIMVTVLTTKSTALEGSLADLKARGAKFVTPQLKQECLALVGELQAHEKKMKAAMLQKKDSLDVIKAKLMQAAKAAKQADDMLKEHRSLLPKEPKEPKEPKKEEKPKTRGAASVAASSVARSSKGGKK